MIMVRAGFLGARLLAAYLREALSREGRGKAPFHARRLVVLSLLAPLFFVLQALHWTGFLLDALLFPAYRRVLLRRPVFISGIPRSGTTFVHRSLASGLIGFTTFSTWEALFAPSITERMLLRFAARADRLIGSPGRKALAWGTRRLTANDALHPIRLDEGEEDYLALLPVAACFILILLFPASPATWRLARLDQWAPRDRDVLLEYYHRCLQRHLFFHGQNKTLLSKNAAFASWLPYLHARYTDARFLVCVRPPAEALLSNLSSLKPALEGCGTAPAAPTIAANMAATFLHGLKRLHAFTSTMQNGNRLVILDQPALKANPEALLDQACAKIGIPLTRDPKEASGPRNQKAAPVHRHAWFPNAPIPAQFSSQADPIYEEILRHPCKATSVNL